MLKGVLNQGSKSNSLIIDADQNYSEEIHSIVATYVLGQILHCQLWSSNYRLQLFSIHEQVFRFSTPNKYHRSGRRNYGNPDLPYENIRKRNNNF